MSRKYFGLKMLIDKHDIITFDIFDTLLKRDVNAPKDVFGLVEKKYNRIYANPILEFKQNRISAERIARDRKKTREVTIDEIYEEMNHFSTSEREILKNLELSIEHDVSCVNYDIKRIFEYCKCKNKRIYFISDMYLPTEYIVRLLEKAGYQGYEKVYVSNEYSCSKRTGELFKILLNDYGFSASDVLHIGDSKKADILGAAKAGIKSYYVKTYYHNMLYRKKNDSEISVGYINSFINNRIGNIKERSQKLGFEILGPIIWGYCQWLQKQTADYDKILFFSRDMHLFKKVFRKYFDSEKKSDYIYISRKALLPAVWYYCSDYRMIFTQWAEKNVDLEKIFCLLGLDLSKYRAKIETYKCDIQKKYLSTDAIPDDDPMWHLLDELTADIKEVNREKAINICKYLDEFMHENENVAVCDLGTNATIQMFLDIINRGRATHINICGCYIGSYLPRVDYPVELKGYIFDFSNLQYDYKSGKFLLEAFCLELIGTVKEYCIENDKVVPVFDNCDQEYLYYIKNLHKGALLFAKLFSEKEMSSSVEIDNGNSILGFWALLNCPDIAEMQEAEKISYFDRNKYYLLECRSLGYYITHIYTLANDVIKARWKAALLKHVFGIPLHYHDLYYAILGKR